MTDELTWILVDGKPLYLSDFLRTSTFVGAALNRLGAARQDGLVVRRLKIVDHYAQGGQHHRDAWLLAEYRRGGETTELLLVRASDLQVLAQLTDAQQDDDASLDRVLQPTVESLRQDGVLCDSAMGWIRLADLGHAEGLVQRLADKGLEAWWEITNDGADFGWLALARYLVYTQRFHLRKRMRWKGTRWESITLYDETHWELEASEERAQATLLGPG